MLPPLLLLLEHTGTCRPRGDGCSLPRRPGIGLGNTLALLLLLRPGAADRRPSSTAIITCEAIRAMRPSVGRGYVLSAIQKANSRHRRDTLVKCRGELGLTRTRPTRQQTTQEREMQKGGIRTNEGGHRD